MSEGPTEYADEAPSVVQPVPVPVTVITQGMTIRAPIGEGDELGPPEKFVTIRVFSPVGMAIYHLDPVSAMTIAHDIARVAREQRGLDMPTRSEVDEVRRSKLFSPNRQHRRHPG